MAFDGRTTFQIPRTALCVCILTGSMRTFNSIFLPLFQDSWPLIELILDYCTDKGADHEAVKLLEVMLL